MRLRPAILLLALSALAGMASADDVGITEVRLVEEDRQTYAMEAEVSPFLVGAIQRPVLPARCRFVGGPEHVPVGPMLVVRYRFTTGDTPLGPEDEILLPWQRTGIVLTAHWLDGSSQRAFFERELAGIRVPVRVLREVDVTPKMLVSRGVSDAAAYMLRLGWAHLLLVLACACLGSVRRMAHLLLAFAAGHGVALVATDLGMPTVHPTIVTILLGVSALLMYRASVRANEGPVRFWPVLILLGLLHGLGYAGSEVGRQVALSTEELILARFAFNTAVDVFHGVLGAAVWITALIGRKGHPSRRVRSAVAYVGGGLAAVVIFAAMPVALAPVQPEMDIVSRPISGMPGAGTATPAISRPVDVTDPLMVFVTITAFEVRCEWMVRVRDLQPLGALSESGEEVLPIQVQAALKDSLMRRFAVETVVVIDEQLREPSVVRADFVTVGTYGVTTRTAPVPEPLERAVIGISLAYAVEDAPRSASVHLRPYPADVASVPVAVSDPWGSAPGSLTPDRPGIGWQRRMAAFRRPVIRAVTVAPVTWPLASVGLLVVAVIAVLVGSRRGATRGGVRVAYTLCTAAVVAYPFLRAPAPAVLSGRLPADDDTRQALTQLLTNIYRAFDYRTEDAIYDRLEVSATGDQLAAIYLDHLRALELENRGGARASVDEVDVQNVRRVAASDQGFRLDADWTVSGSVSHFGHTHYRKNRYAAAVSIIVEDGAWKISGIEVLEEERVL